MRLIDADNLKRVFAKEPRKWYIAKSIMEEIEAAPTFKAEPVRHGRWVKIPDTELGSNDVFCVRRLFLLSKQLLSNMRCKNGWRG